MLDFLAYSLNNRSMDLANPKNVKDTDVREFLAKNMNGKSNMLSTSPLLINQKPEKTEK